MLTEQFSLYYSRACYLESDMPSEMMPPSTSRLTQEEPQASIPSSSSSVSRDRSTTHRSRTLNRVASAGPSTISRHEASTALNGRPDVIDDASSTPIIPTYFERKPLTAGKANRTSASCSAASRKSMHPAKVQRWAGLTRTVSDWNLLRRVGCSRRMLEN